MNSRVSGVPPNNQLHEVVCRWRLGPAIKRSTLSPGLATRRAPSSARASSALVAHSYRSRCHNPRHRKCTTRVTDAFSIGSATNEQDRAGALHRSWSTSRTEGEVGVTNALHTDSATPKVRPACQRTPDWRRAGVRRNPTPSQPSAPTGGAQVRRAWNPNGRFHLAGLPSAREDLAELARLFSCRRLALIRSTSRGHGHQFHACAEVAHRPLRGRFGPVRILTRSCRPRRARGRRW